MLALTDQAAAAIRDLTTQPDLPADTGVRISSGTESTASPQLNLALSTGPAEGDTVLEADGARIYADPIAVEVLDGKTLDAQSDGAGGVQFTVMPTVN